MNRNALKDFILSGIHSVGYVQLEAAEVQDPDIYLLELMSSFARPISYFDQPIIMNVKPIKGANPASYAGIGKLDLHTDITWFSTPPKYIVMMCISVGEGGGIPLISDGWKALESIDGDTIESLKAHMVSFAAPSHVQYQGHTAPILTQYDGKFRIRYRSDLLREDATEAINLFSKAVHKQATQLAISPGSIWIVDNYRVLHGRTAIDAGINSHRFLKRVYASDSL
jgi:alpha-ketoglutarate-dependent taurine dioxygenase